MDIGVAGDVDGRDHLARELLEHEVLVLCLGTELSGLEQALAVEVGIGEQVDRSACRNVVSCQREIGGRLHPAKGEGRIAGIEALLT